jgi:hypothetical protein
MFVVLAKQKHKREIQKLASEYEGSLKASEMKIVTIKQKLAVAKEQVLKEKDRWQMKLDSMNDEIEKANDRVYQEKARRRALLISASAVALRSHWYKSLEICQKGLSESYLLPPLILCVSMSISF